MKKRELSDFMTQELLYDYAYDLLDEERKKAVIEVLEKSEEARSDLKTIQAGLQYTESLSKALVAIKLAQSVSQRVTYFSRIQKIMSYENWPPFVKWTLEAVLVISVVITVSLIAPWGRVKDFVMRTKKSDLILAQLPKSETTTAVESLNTIEKVEKGNYEDESGGDDAGTKAEAPAQVAEVAVKSEPPPKKTPVAARVEHKAEEAKKKGFVYRGTLSIVNAEAGTTKLKEKIVELGGRKAGEVELGWRRNEGDYYFHFTIPESKLDTLQEYFKTLGNIKLSKDPHPRVMPDGIVRMIITTEESK